MAEDTRTLETIIEGLLAGRKGMKVLEAGCGQWSHLTYSKHVYLVGVDISREQLDKNPIIHEKIIGDIQEDILPPAHFDLIVCWHVLEHISKPQLALKHFAEAVNKGGLILLTSPNVLTLRGLLTKFLPYRVHFWYHRYIVGNKDAGTAGNPPFKSFHRLVLTPSAIKKFARTNNLTVELCRYPHWDQAEYRFTLFRMIWPALNRLVNILSFGLIRTDEEKGFQIILRKN